MRTHGESTHRESPSARLQWTCNSKRSRWLWSSLALCIDLPTDDSGSISCGVWHQQPLRRGRSIGGHTTARRRWELQVPDRGEGVVLLPAGSRVTGKGRSLLSLASLEGDIRCQAKTKPKNQQTFTIIYVFLNWGHLLLIMVGRQVNTAAMGTNRLIPAVGHAHSLKVIQSPTRNWARPPRAFLDLTSDGNFAKVSTAAAPGSWTLAEHQRFFWTQTQLQSSHVTWRLSCFFIHSLCPASLLSYIPSYLCIHKDELVLSKCRPVW